MARRSAATDLRQELYQTVEHKGVKIELNPGWKHLRPYYSIGGYSCDTLEEAIKKANYIVTKERKLKDPIPVLIWERRDYRNADIVEIFNDGDIVVQDYETGEKKRFMSYELTYKPPFTDTPENRSILDAMVKKRKEIEDLENVFKDLKASLTPVDLTRKEKTD